MGFDLYGNEAVSERGEYFRNNVWWWPRLWTLVSITCRDILSEEDIKQGWSNDGHIIDAEKAQRVGERLCEILGDEARHKTLEIFTERSAEESRSKRPESKLTDAIRDAGFDIDVPGRYPFDWENVRDFATFCRESGGFKIS